MAEELPAPGPAATADSLSAEAGADQAPRRRLARPAATTLLRWGPPVVLTIVAGHELLYNDSGWLDWLLVMGVIWPLAWRWRAPLLVLGVCLAAAAVLWVHALFSVAGVALLIALYTVAAHRGLRQAVAATALLEAAVVVAAFRFAPRGSVDDAVVLLSGLVATALFLGTTMRAKRHYLAGLEDRAARLEIERQQQAQLAAAAERTRIAREMNDIVAHGLAVMITMSEGAASQAVANPADAQTAMRQVAATGRQSLVQMRRLLRVLREEEAADRGPQPLLAELQDLHAQAQAIGLQVDASHHGDLDSIPRAAQATLYRLVQEALTNVLKHAPQAKSVTVTLVAEPGRVGFDIRDDGGPPTARPSEGQGLRGMRERAALFGGSVQAGPSESGWSVHGCLDVS